MLCFAPPLRRRRHRRQVSAHPKCRLVVTVLEGSASGGGHAFSLSGAVVSAVAAKMERGKIGPWDYDKGAT